MKTIKKCDICGEEVKEKVALYDCDNCRTILTNPRLTLRELKKHYSKDYYAFDRIRTQDESMKVRSRLFLYETYYCGTLGLSNIFLRVLCLPLKFLSRGTRVVPGWELLDVGCGNGQFLYEMFRLGLNGEGIEPNINFNGLLDGIKPDLFKAKYLDERFDLITMNHVLQHVENPSKMLKEIHRVLNTYGLFIVSASNTSSLAYFLFGNNWFQLDIPRHLFNCRDKTLIQFLEGHGFKVIKNRHNSRPTQFVVSLCNAFGIEYKGGFASRIFEVFFLPLTWIVNVLKVGDQVEIWCIKEDVDKK